MIDAGFVFVMLGIAFVLLIAKIQYREFFQFLSATIFFLLGIQIMAGDDMAFFTVINDGVNPINQTNYLIGNGTATYGFSSFTMGFFLLLLGIVSTFVGMLSWFSFNPGKK